MITRSNTLNDAGQILKIFVTIFTACGVSYAAEPAKTSSSYAPVVIKESFPDLLARMKAEKPEVMIRQMDLLNKRYDLSDRSS